MPVETPIEPLLATLTPVDETVKVPRLMNGVREVDHDDKIVTRTPAIPDDMLTIAVVEKIALELVSARATVPPPDNVAT
jgi:hypothetical protein